MKASKTLKKGTEAALWLLFLVFCWTLGYFQGSRPDFKWLDLVQTPVTIHVLTVSEKFFPKHVKQAIEKHTHTHIELELISSWKELSVRLVSSPSPELLLIPSHWAQTLHQEGLLSEGTVLTDLQTQLASDFQITMTAMGGKTSQEFLPLYWSKLMLMKNTEKTKTLSFLNDADLFLQYSEEIRKRHEEKNFNSLSFFLFDFDRLTEKFIPTQDLFLVTHMQSENQTEWKKTIWPEAVYILGVALSKNMENKTQTLLVLKSYVSPEMQKQIIPYLPWASTLLFAEEEKQIHPLQKPSYLRNLELSQVVQLKTKDKDAVDKTKAVITDSPFAH